MYFESEDWRLLGDGAVWPGRILPTFWRRIRPPYFPPKTKAIRFDEITIRFCQTARYRMT